MLSRSHLSDNPNGSLSTLGHLCIGLPDDTQAEMDAAQLAYELRHVELASQDDNRCRECGDITSGSEMGGTHVQLCDRCIASWAINMLGAALVQDVLTDTESAA